MYEKFIENFERLLKDGGSGSESTPEEYCYDLALRNETL